MVVATEVQSQVSEHFSAGAEHADVQVVDQDEDGCAVVAAADADVVEPALVPQGQLAVPERWPGRRSGRPAASAVAPRSQRDRADSPPLVGASAVALALTAGVALDEYLGRLADCGRGRYGQRGRRRARTAD